jgi:TRAP-type C4-dicarboxylate transport system permease large subunit
MSAHVRALSASPRWSSGASPTLRGGLSVVNVFATTFLSGISGSAVADTSAIGSLMIPQMGKSGFPLLFAANVTIRFGTDTAGAAQPQHGHLFAGDRRQHLDHQPVQGAGVVPCLLFGFSTMVPCLVTAYRDRLAILRVIFAVCRCW